MADGSMAASDLAASNNMTRSSFGASVPINGRSTMGLGTPSFKYGATSVAASPRASMTAADELRALRAHNDALQKQLALKDQGLERLRQKVHERALMLSHQQAADVQQTRREAGSMIGELEAENAKLRADLAHRTSQLHSAVTRIGALKNRMDDLILQNDELIMKNEKYRTQKASARRRTKTLREKAPGPTAQREAMASLLGTQDSMLNLIETLSFLPPQDETDGTAGGGTPLTQAAPKAAAGDRASVATASGATGGANAAHTANRRSGAAMGSASATVACATPRAAGHATASAPSRQTAATRSSDPIGGDRGDRSHGGGTTGEAPSLAQTPGRCVEATSVAIARRPVPVIAWSTGGGSGGGFASGGGGCSVRDLASQTPTRSELTRNLEILAKGDVHTRLAAFEGRFGPPERLPRYSVDEPGGIAPSPAGAGEPTGSRG